MIRRMIKSTTIEVAGYTLLEADNGQEGINVSRTCDGDIHLLLTNVIMPKMNCRDDAISYPDVLEIGVHFILKPITPSVLAKKLREAIKK